MNDSLAEILRTVQLILRKQMDISATQTAMLQLLEKRISVLEYRTGESK